MREELLSVVIPVGVNQATLLQLLDPLSDFLAVRFRNFEMIVVNDSADATLEKALSDRVATMRNLRVLSLARRYGDATATLAGMQHAIGDVSAVLRSDDAPSVIDDMLGALDADTDVVFATPVQGGDWRARILSRITRSSRLSIPNGAGQTALLRRRALNAILTLRDRIVHLPLLASYLGLRIKTVATSQSRPMTTRELLEQLEAICAYSPWPLWGLALFVLALGGFGTAVCLLQWIQAGFFDGRSFVILLAMLSVTGLAGMMVMVASFIGRILQETKRQPLYYVTGEQSSRRVEIESIVQRK